MYTCWSTCACAKSERLNVFEEKVHIHKCASLQRKKCTFVPVCRKSAHLYQFAVKKVHICTSFQKKCTFVPVCRKKVHICAILQKKVDDDKEETGDKPPLLPGEPRFAILRGLWNYDRSWCPSPNYTFTWYIRAPTFKRTPIAPINSQYQAFPSSKLILHHILHGHTKAKFIVD